ncbi:Pollen Ole e 1 allergen/extensin [Corchorus olitorius]|uniref:Pollen Ole e 1 allergen/extensin n=1 Tax=Corchorus olitorius TaxID=93759 RepID=A0A1R3GP34_9ROSI|nr:Pollen Ole e 1 allergen/extensin [Corchorus olitorius]
MALRPLITALFFLVAIARIQLSTSQVLEGKVSCLDCKHDYDYSGIMVQVKCAQVKKLATATAEEDGSFKFELPSDKTKTPSPQKCLARLLGGPNQLYGRRKNLMSTVVKAHGLDSCTISTPLTFSTSCPLATQDAKCGAPTEIGSSKTVDLPLPPEWGLAPSSYYVPFFPIIGIP